jgi:hypothetical protein
MDLTWTKIFGRSIVAIVALLLSIYVVKCTHGCKGNFYNVNYVLVAYMFVITLVVLKEADSMSGLNIQAKLTKNGYMENYRRQISGAPMKSSEYYTGVNFG